MAPSSIGIKVSQFRNHIGVGTDHERSLSLCMVLVNIEVAIIGTSLISITDDLHGFSQMGWVVTGYLITYTGGFICVCYDCRLTLVQE